MIGQQQGKVIFRLTHYHGNISRASIKFESKLDKLGNKQVCSPSCMFENLHYREIALLDWVRKHTSISQQPTISSYTQSLRGHQKAIVNFLWPLCSCSPGLSPLIGFCFEVLLSYTCHFGIYHFTLVDPVNISNVHFADCIV